ncbi:gas vesicle protein GvpG [Streptomyces sp. NPDC093099]|uniref:gas vesicle protein GvpG n=1 Tax=Streptomyces sp. NPDC093099 TaxID=3366028 RepID=UPI003814C68D
MGLISGLLLFPLAPVRGVSWIAEQLMDAADRQIHDPALIRAQLTALNKEFEDGNLSLEEFEEAEERLLDRLDEAGAGPGERSKAVHSWMREPR